MSPSPDPGTQARAAPRLPSTPGWALRILGSLAADAGRPPAPAWRRYGGAGVAVAAATLVLWPVREVVGLLNSGLLLLVVVIGATVLAGQGAGILAAVLGFGLFELFLVPADQALALTGLANILALAVFLGVSLLLSALIEGARAQAVQAQDHAADVSRLYELSQAIVGAHQLDEVLPAIAEKVVAVFHAQVCWILLPDAAGRLVVQAEAPAGARVPAPEEARVAEWTFRHGGDPGPLGRPVPALDQQVRDGRTAFVPLCAAGRPMGLLVVADKTDRRPFTAAERTVLATFADQAVVALERLALLREAQRAETLARTDELKSALMSAVSHDLRTPLASIIASVTSLLEPGMYLDGETRSDLLQGIYDESRRLNRLVGNLLDMSRIEGGALHPAKDWYSIAEVIEGVLERMEPRLAAHPLTVTIAPGIPLVLLDFTEIDQVLTNLLENAIRYTPPGTPIMVTAQSREERIEVRVADQGPGVAPEHLAYLFDKFYRAGSGRSADGGTGLGLAISKGFIVAHGGEIWAESSPGAGMAVTFTLPISGVPDRPAAPALALPGGAAR